MGGESEIIFVSGHDFGRGLEELPVAFEVAVDGSSLESILRMERADRHAEAHEDSDLHYSLTPPRILSLGFAFRSSLRISNTSRDTGFRSSRACRKLSGATCVAYRSSPPPSFHSKRHLPRRRNETAK